MPRGSAVGFRAGNVQDTLVRLVVPQCQKRVGVAQHYLEGKKHTAGTVEFELTHRISDAAFHSGRGKARSLRLSKTV